MKEPVVEEEMTLNRSVLFQLACDCPGCYWRGDSTEMLITMSPFNSKRILCGCPRCKSVGTLTRLRDKPGLDGTMTDEKRLDWLNEEPTRLLDVYWHIENEGGSVRSAIEKLELLQRHERSNAGVDERKR